MIFLFTSISLNLLSTGSLQDVNNPNNLVLSQPDHSGYVPDIGAQSWPVQTIQTVEGNFFGQAFRKIHSKPCSGRRSLQEPEEKWIPTFSSRIIKPIPNFDSSKLQTTVENIEVKNYVPVAAPVNMENLGTPALDNNENNLYKTRNSLSVDNNVKDTIKDISEPDDLLGIEDITEVKEIPEVEDRVGFEIEASNEGTLEFKEKDIVENQYDEKLSENMVAKTEQPEKMFVTETIVTTEKLSDECFNKKEAVKFNDNFGGSRRSMTNSNKEIDFDKVTSSSNHDLENRRESVEEGSSNNWNMKVNSNDVKLNTINEKNYSKTVISTRKANLFNKLAEDPSKLERKIKSMNSKNDPLEPTKGSGISELTESQMILVDHERLCYACSTASNPTCWAPDRRTTVKYCRKGHEACVMKTFDAGNALTLVRDCGNSCEDVDTPGFIPKYKSCSICHSDLCNSAYSVSHNLIFAIFLLGMVTSMY